VNGRAAAVEMISNRREVLSDGYHSSLLVSVRAGLHTRRINNVLVDVDETTRMSYNRTIDVIVRVITDHTHTHTAQCLSRYSPPADWDS